MSGSLSKKFVLIVGSLAFVVACSGGAGLNPATPGFDTASPVAQALREQLGAQFPAGVVERMLPYATENCGTGLPAPKDYSLLIATGELKAGVFSASSKSLWYDVLLIPSTKPVASPSAEPSVAYQPENLYFGAYALKRTGHGCFIMVASKNGKPLVGETYNAFGVGFPFLKSKDKYEKFKFLNQGPLQAKVTGLKTTGSGTATLLNSSGGGTYDSGTISNVLELKIP